MIGDRLETEYEASRLFRGTAKLMQRFSITFGNDGKIQTLLVLSGSSQLEDIGKSRAAPDYVCDSLGQVADLLDIAHQHKMQDAAST